MGVRSQCGHRTPHPPARANSPGGERGRHPAQIPRGFGASNKGSGAWVELRVLASKLMSDDLDNPVVWERVMDPGPRGEG